MDKRNIIILLLVMTIIILLGLFLPVRELVAPDEALSSRPVVTENSTATEIPAGTFPAAPAISHGPLSGEVSSQSVVLWARGNRPGQLNFTLFASNAPNTPLHTTSVEVTTISDLTGKVTIASLTPGRSYNYQVSLTSDQQTSQPRQGQFHTPAEDNSPFSFVFSSCLGGQGYCRDKENGWLIFEAMLANQPDFFLLTGDSIYADTACTGDTIVPGAEGPYNSLDGFRTRYRYQLEDSHYANFLAQTPVYVTWDDHEIINDFGGPALKLLNPGLLSEGQQAYFEYWPLVGTTDEPFRVYRHIAYTNQADFFLLDSRSYRDANVNWDPNPTTLQPKTMLGADQLAWLKQSLVDSEATWKFIVSSVPLSYPTGFPQPQVDGRDGWANYSEPSGYETELMQLLYFIESHAIQNVVFLAGDTHWPFAISYDPDRDGAANFYELGAGPLSAIPLAPSAIPDQTFGPTVLYAEGEFRGTLFNFGQIGIDPAGTLTFRVLDWQGQEHYSLTLNPRDS